MPGLPTYSGPPPDPIGVGATGSRFPARVRAGSRLMVEARLGNTNHLLRLTLERDGAVVLDLPLAVVEQRRPTAIAMVLADAMDMPIESVRVTVADARPMSMVDPITGGCSARYSLVGPIRALAALARQRLTDAAAREWGVSALDLQLRDGVVFGPGGRLSTYGTLTEAAAS